MSVRISVYMPAQVKEGTELAPEVYVINEATFT